MSDALANLSPVVNMSVVDHEGGVVHLDHLDGHVGNGCTEIENHGIVLSDHSNDLHVVMFVLEHDLEVVLVLVHIKSMGEECPVDHHVEEKVSCPLEPL